uniref:Uncharacterized protein n=1 Tax=Rhizophora mucronata TaxID=61149 RepID=A0A2P2JNF8_RHIMU
MVLGYSKQHFQLLDFTFALLIASPKKAATKLNPKNIGKAYKLAWLG